MNPAPAEPGAGPQRIRTGDPLLSPCPGCGGPLEACKTVCSPRCRARRWRATQKRRNRELREHAEAILRLLDTL